MLLGMKENNYFLLRQKEDINFQDFIDFLSKHNYFRTNNVQQIGEMSVKGDIVDVFPFGFTEPIRIDFNFDTVEKIRKFDIQTKRMKSTEASVKIYPMTANYISKIFTKKTKRPKGRFTKEEINEVMYRFRAGQTVYKICRDMKRRQVSIRRHLMSAGLIPFEILDRVKQPKEQRLPMDLSLTVNYKMFFSLVFVGIVLNPVYMLSLIIIFIIFNF